MKIALNFVANVILSIAEFGMGFRSMGLLYQPEIPEELFDNSRYKMNK